MIAKFTIDAIPALAALDRGKGIGADDPTVGLWEFLHSDRWTMLGKVPRARRRMEDSPVNGTSSTVFRPMSDS